MRSMNKWWYMNIDMWNGTKLERSSECNRTTIRDDVVRESGRYVSENGWAQANAEWQTRWRAWKNDDDDDGGGENEYTANHSALNSLSGVLLFARLFSHICTLCVLLFVRSLFCFVFLLFYGIEFLFSIFLCDDSARIHIGFSIFLKHFARFFSHIHRHIKCLFCLSKIFAKCGKCIHTLSHAHNHAHS